MNDDVLPKGGRVIYEQIYEPEIVWMNVWIRMGIIHEKAPLLGRIVLAASLLYCR